ncbi:MAG: cold-shock DNA-binding protein family [Bradyrhizobium sp.]|nr:cold-shock DNA-binding protein family [Bradyrhizobium sp.]
MRADVATGTVKWFNATKGYNFMQPDFSSIFSMEKPGLSDLCEGAEVAFDIVPNKGKESAEKSASARGRCCQGVASISIGPRAA